MRLARTGDYALPNDGKRAEAVGAALFMSLHMIRSDDPDRHGAEIYFSQDVPASVRAAAIFACSPTPRSGCWKDADWDRRH